MGAGAKSTGSKRLGFGASLFKKIGLVRSAPPTAATSLHKRGSAVKGADYEISDEGVVLWHRVGADKVEALTYSILREHPLLAEDDKLLLLAVWYEQGLELTPEQKEIWFSECSTPESITRVRRRLLEQHIIKQSPETAERRQAKANAYRGYYGKRIF